MSVSAPERSFWGPNDAVSNYVQLLYFGPGRVQNLEAAGSLGSLLRSLDPLTDGEIAVHSSRTSNRFQSWSQFLALWSSSADRRARRVMQKSLKALRGTEYCRYTCRWDSWRCPGQKWRRKLKIMWCCRVMSTALYVLRGINGKGGERRKKQFVHKGKSVLCACTARSLVFEYLNI